MAQATRTELVKRQQQQQVSTTSARPKTALKSETKPTEAAANCNKAKPSYKHIPHSQKPAHLVAKRNARERRRVKAVNEAFNTLKKCVPIQNRNKRVSKVKTLQRAIDHIRHLQALLEADNEAGGTSAGEHQRIFVSSKAGEEAELRLAMSPEPRRRAAPATRLAKIGGSASLRQQLSESQADQLGPRQQRRGRKPNAIKQQEAAAAAAMKQQQQQQVSTSVLMDHHQQHANQHYLIETQTEEYASGPQGAAPAHYYGLPQSTCPSGLGDDLRAPAYAYGSESTNQQAHYQSYESAAHYQQPAFHAQYQQQAAASYGSHFYAGAGHHVPYGDADSTTALQQQPMGWQPVPAASSGSSRSSGGAPLDSSFSQLSGSPASSASLTQLMCNLNSSNSSSECSSSGPNASCLYNGNAQQHRQPRAMAADSTTPSSTATGGARAASKKCAFSLIHSPYSTASSSSHSSASNSFSAANKSLDSSAPLDLKHADKSSPPSAAGGQVNNYANNYALPTFIYDPQRQQSDESAKLIGQHSRHKSDVGHESGFLCVGHLYRAEEAHQEQQERPTNYGPNSGADFHKHHPGPVSHQTHLGAASKQANSNVLYNAPTPL